MRVILNILFSTIFGFFVVACVTSYEPPKPPTINPLARSFGAPSDPDPLKLGNVPMLYLKQVSPTLVEGDPNIPKVPTTPPVFRSLSSIDYGFNQMIGPFSHDISMPFEDTPTFAVPYIVSSPIGLMSPGGNILSVWAIGHGNWVWGYTLLDSASFGDARMWQMLVFPKNFVMIKNMLTFTCLNAYGDGVIHYTCDSTNRAQMWELKPMSNQAIQIKNFAQGRCLQISVKNPKQDPQKAFAIHLSDCVPSGMKTLEQQWYVIDVVDYAKPIYRIR